MSEQVNPFTFLNAINESKENLMRGSADDRLMEKSYNPFIVNRTLSYFPDTLGYAQEMNLRWEIDHVCQFEYLLNMVRKRKRRRKWDKPVKVENIDLIMEYYGCNRQRALETVEVLTDDQIETMRARLYKGGN